MVIPWHQYPRAWIIKVKISDPKSKVLYLERERERERHEGRAGERNVGDTEPRWARAQEEGSEAN